MYRYPFSPPDGMEQKYYERGMRHAIKLATRESRMKEKQKELDEKKSKAAAERRVSSLEWFIIGILMYPVVGPLYLMAINHLNAISMVKP